MQDLLNKFIADYTGKTGVGTTLENTGECVGLIQKWITIICPSASYIWGHAKDLFANIPASYYISIKNTPEGIPQAGDIICWNGNMGGGFGHTAIVVKADINTITVFEQNTGIKTPHMATYSSYVNVIGWFRPRVLPVVEPMVTISQKELDALRQARDTHYNELQDAKKAIITLNQKIEQLTNVVNEDARDDHDLGLKNLALETELRDIVKALDLPPDSEESIVLEKIKSLQKPHAEVVRQVIPVMDELAEAAIFKRSKKAKSLFDKIRAFFHI